jgi:hypothetical protein
MRTVSATAEIAATGFFNEAALSAASALTSEGLADGHRSAAATSADEAMNSAASADNFADAALSSVVDAQNFATAASDSADAAAGSVASISGFADAASDSADAAALSAANALISEGLAAGHRSAAATSADEAADASRLTLGTVTTSAPGEDGDVTITGAAGAQVLNFVVPQGPQGVGPVTIADAAPTSPTDGMLWMRTTTEILYLYSSAQSRWIIPYALDVDRELDSDDEFLSLNLQFSRDKTLTARRGPTPTFSRASGGTYVGSDGLIHGIDTSITLNSISIASKTFTLSATAGQDQKWRVGDAVEASNGANFMVGTVTSYTPSTQVLVCNMTGSGGTGTFTSWRVSYRGPRFDHDPVTLACKGLLIEESRTNTMLTSEQFDSASWNAAGLRTLTVTANDSASPSGAMDADRLTVGATTTSYRVVQNTANVISGTAYTFTCFLKANQVTRAQIYAGNTTTLPLTAIFDLTGNGSVVSNAFGTASIQNYGNGWYRCIITGTAGANSNTSISIHPVSGTLATYPGNSVDSFYAWGAQLEAGSFPTSYIPTAATAPLTRSADVCSITDLSWLSGSTSAGDTAIVDFVLTHSTDQNGGSIFTGVSASNASSAFAILMSSNNRNRALYRLGSDDEKTDIRVESWPAELILNKNTKIGFTGGQGIKAQAALDGGLSVGQSSSIPVDVLPLSYFGIGSRNGINTACINIRSIRYYKKRLTNFKLQSLTS